MSNWTPAEKELLMLMLERAASEMGDNSCNDFDLKKVMPNIEERRALAKQFHEWNGDPEEFNPDGGYENFFDFCLMYYLTQKLKRTL